MITNKKLEQIWKKERKLLMKDAIEYTRLSKKDLLKKLSFKTFDTCAKEWNSKPRKTQKDVEKYYKFSSEMFWHHLWYQYIKDYGKHYLKLKYINTNGTILDFGSGLGTISILIDKIFNKQVHCCEINENLITFTDFRQGYNILCASDSKELFKQHINYSTILFLDVLEHLPNYEYILKKAIESLQQYGVIIEYTSQEFSRHPMHFKTNIEQSMKKFGMHFLNKVDIGKGNVWIKK